MEDQNHSGTIVKNAASLLLVSLCWGTGGPLVFVASQTLLAYDVTFWRCLIAFIFMLPFFLRDGLPTFTKLDWQGRLLLVAAGATLALHFFLFILGVNMASMSTAVILVALEPVLILLVGAMAFHERIHRHSGIGMAICILGLVIVSLAPLTVADSKTAMAHRWIGDLFCTLAVVVYVFYYAVNRALRKHYVHMVKDMSPLRSSFGLSSIIYLFAALAAMLLSLGAHWYQQTSFTRPPTEALWALFGLGLFPTLIGHFISQLTSRHMHPIWVSLMSPGESIFALILGFLFLQQVPQNLELIGGAIIIGGVIFVIAAEAAAMKKSA